MKENNLVEMVVDSDECTFDQECKFGHRVGGHAVYCKCPTWGSPRKCYFGWYSGGVLKDCKCPYFEVNEEWSGGKDE